MQTWRVPQRRLPMSSGPVHRFRTGARVGRSAAWLLGSMLLLASSVAYAKTAHVPGDHPSIGAALADPTLTHGDTILVGPGTWSGSGNRNLRYDGKDLVVRSTHGAAMTIIDAQGVVGDSARVFLFDGDQEPFEGRGAETRNAVLDGFTLVNGLMASEAVPEQGIAKSRRRPDDRIQHDLSGGGIMCRLDASPTIRNCIIRNCSSEFTGGGIGVEFSSNPLFENVIVQGCTAGLSGGGVSVELAGIATFVDCVVTGNSAPVGGGIAAHDDTSFQGCVIADNVARRGGGVDAIFPATVDIQRTILWNNCANDSGAQMWVDPAIPLFDGALTISCSAVDTLGIRDTGSVTQFLQSNVFDDPRLCEPLGCGQAPGAGGHYTVREDSPCLPAGNDCGVLIGAFPHTCSTPVERRSMTQIKSLFR